MSVGIPIKVLHEAQGLTVTVETRINEVYRGKLVGAEDNMNVLMVDVSKTFRDGKVTHVDTIFIRGSKINFIILPGMLKNAPMFKRMKPPTLAETKERAAEARKQALLIKNTGPLRPPTRPPYQIRR
ncbi:hypothetical protein A3Q56_06333 [Intoshia linei]|uniref:Small nuclear ribonucleoprotein Sm D3 n=1 Tax=Intoshia linei TaxID=1819745 RepID=A0A177AXM5_9BILA|nr:hypothetical protein A3Q56_06333 [Intoshia linei]